MLIFRRLPAVLLAGLCAAVAVALWFGLVQAAPATGPTTRFAAAGGSGGTCSQSAPCLLPTGLAQSSNGDTLYVEQGHYTGSGAAVITVTRSITLYGGWTGNPVGLPVRDPAAHPTTIDGQTSRRGMFVSSGLTPTIDGFVIRNGNASGLVNTCSLDSPSGCGGGIFVDHAAAHISHNQFISNVALITTTEFALGHGGGLFLEWASGSVISANTFLSNSAILPPTLPNGNGGGMAVTGYNTDSVLIANNTFSANTAYFGGGLALVSGKNQQVLDNLFQNNTATQGGGLFSWLSSATVTGNTFRGNTGNAPVYLGYFAGSVGANLIVDNPTAAGVQLFNDYTTNNVVLYNNIIAHNGSVGIQAHGYISLPLTVLSLNNTLVGPGSGTALLVANGYVTVTADNTLISGFSTGVSVSYPFTSHVSLIYTLFDTNVGATGAADFTHTVTGAAGFIDPAHQNFHIGFNSAARDSGGPTYLTTDIDGDPRLLGAAIDIGADETRFALGVFLPLMRR